MFKPIQANSVTAAPQFLDWWTWSFQKTHYFRIGWGATGLRNGHRIKKLELLDEVIETTGFRNWSHWIKKLVREH